MSTTSNTDMSTDIPMSDPHWDGYTVRKRNLFKCICLNFQEYAYLETLAFIIRSQAEYSNKCNILIIL